MKAPKKLFRYRSLGNESNFEQELEALRESFLFAPSFASMNDPMEAQYEFGGPNDKHIDSVLRLSGNSLTDLYGMASLAVDSFGLISFSETNRHFPLWAYYASNFAGVCLEFDTERLSVGDLQNEKLHQVVYDDAPFPPLGFSDFSSRQVEEKVTARLIRKRNEWAHEKEWRFITGEVGAKRYLDDALSRVFLGPRINAEYSSQLCRLFDCRAVEVLQAEVIGRDMRFETIKPPRSIEACERVGAGVVDIVDQVIGDEEVRAFLDVPIARLLDAIRHSAARPNMETIWDVAVIGGGRLFVGTEYKLRNGRAVNQRRYFDSYLNELPERHSQF